MLLKMGWGRNRIRVRGKYGFVVSKRSEDSEGMLRDIGCVHGARELGRIPAGLQPLLGKGRKVRSFHSPARSAQTGRISLKGNMWRVGSSWVSQQAGIPDPIECLGFVEAASAHEWKQRRLQPCVLNICNSFPAIEKQNAGYSEYFPWFFS